ncbi:MAG: PHP domain-containing protein [Candidatus Omnitrophica bacterium]|nr:PHP domain-containing protein [Candidatus Omnitrophota bacterium]
MSAASPDSRTADLHTHTCFSDGTERPRRLVELAKQAGLSALAITDHDILDGLIEAAPAAAELGVELIAGLEMSASWEGQEVHMLGFYLDLGHQGLQQALGEQRARRIQRVEEMVVRLQQLGLAITLEDVRAASGPGAVGRPHVAQALVNRGHVSTLKEAFTRYIGADGPAYIPGSPLPPKVAIQAILQAGGIPVLAHPVYLKDDGLIEQMARDGLAGLEVYHSSHKADAIRRYEQLADRFGLLPTGGTDFHGAAKEGAPIGSVTVPYRLVEALKQWKRARISGSCA